MIALIIVPYNTGSSGPSDPFIDLMIALILIGISLSGWVIAFMSALKLLREKRNHRRVQNGLHCEIHQLRRKIELMEQNRIDPHEPEDAADWWKKTRSPED